MITLTGPILAVPVPHHAVALEGPPSSLISRADPLDTNVAVFLKHVFGTRRACPVHFSAKQIRIVSLKR